MSRSSQIVMKKKVKRGIIAGIIVVVIGIIAINISSSFKQTSDQQTSNDKMLMHIHPRLYLNIDGKPYMVPQNVGIDSDLWKDHSLDQYGMKGMAPLHTHTDDGMIHVESNIVRNYTLGQFMDIWGYDLQGKTVGVTAYGKPISDYRNHILQDEEVIIMNLTTTH